MLHKFLSSILPDGGNDAFQICKSRCAINVIWPRKISNDKLYKITNVKCGEHQLRKEYCLGYGI